MPEDNQCPFRPGDTVVYTPSKHGLGWSPMPAPGVPKPGEKYKVAKIEKQAYLCLEGCESDPGGGVYWTEFEKA